MVGSMPTGRPGSLRRHAIELPMARNPIAKSHAIVASALMASALAAASKAGDLEPLRYGPAGEAGPVVDLGVGLWAWPLPMDYDHDGDLDLVVSCPDVPFQGTYLFENPGDGAGRKLPVFLPPRRVGPGYTNIRPSYVGGDARRARVRLLTPAAELSWEGDRSPALGGPSPIYPTANLVGPGARLRANQWQLADFDGDGRLDLIAGVEDWADYGWDNAFDRSGRWTRGPLHGLVYLVRNRGSNDRPEYEPPARLEAGGTPIDVFGMPSPCLADFDGDGDLDLICGEFLDRFTYFENVGTRTAPRYAAGRPPPRQAGGPGRPHPPNNLPPPRARDGGRGGGALVGGGGGGGGRGGGTAQ